MATITAFKAANPYADLGQPASVSRERERLTQLMKEDLHDAAETGWGSGVSDLREAFEHLAANNGRWTDTNWGTYDGQLGLIHGLGPSCTTAQCAANFLDAYEERLKGNGRKTQSNEGRSLAGRATHAACGNQQHRWRRGMEGIRELLGRCSEVVEPGGE